MQIELERLKGLEYEYAGFRGAVEVLSDVRRDHLGIRSIRMWAYEQIAEAVANDGWDAADKISAATSLVEWVIAP